jgi:tetratricopeptide (TPR) repeat protein
LGASVENLGDREGALRRYRQAVALDERRVAAAPADHAAKIDLSHGYASIGNVLSEAGDVEGALASYRQALSLRETAAAADPHDVWARDNVARTHRSLGYVLARAGRHRLALSELRLAKNMVAERFAADRVNVSLAEHLGLIYNLMANSALELGLRADAEKWAKDSLAVWEIRRASGPLTKWAQERVDEATGLLAKAAARR